MGSWEIIFKRESVSRSRQKQNIVQEKKFKNDSTQEITVLLSCEEYLHCHMLNNVLNRNCDTTTLGKGGKRRWVLCICVHVCCVCVCVCEVIADIVLNQLDNV